MRPTPLLSLLLAVTVFAEEPPPVIVLANSSQPESVQLAESYCRLRGVPADRLFALPLPAAETMTREEYKTWLREPLREQLRARGLLRTKGTFSIEAGRRGVRQSPVSCGFRFIAIMRGVPLRVSDTQPKPTRMLQLRSGVGDLRDTASVDAELTVMLTEAHDPRSPYPNPAFGAYHLPFPLPDGQFPLWTGRVDGPDAATARRMLEDAVRMERLGIPGYAYLDADGHAQASNPYFVGDAWLRDAAQRLWREGYETILNPGPDEFEDSFPMEHAGIYLGWYREHIGGALAAPDFAFLPGAIAYHLHSFSALTLRDRDRHWTGPLLARGATASIGCVDEPYLDLTPHLDVFTARLVQGYTLAEAAFYAQPALSWQTTVTGDPLYRPFGTPLDRQIANLEADKSPLLPWGYLRKANQLAREGRFNPALEYTRQKQRETGSPLLREKLADFYAQNALIEEALGEYIGLVRDAATAESAHRAAGKAWQVLLAVDQGAQFDTRFGPLLEKWKTHRTRVWLDKLRTAKPVAP